MGHALAMGLRNTQKNGGRYAWSKESTKESTKNGDFRAQTLNSLVQSLLVGLNLPQFPYDVFTPLFVVIHNDMQLVIIHEDLVSMGGG